MEVGSFAMAQNYAAMSCGQLWYARNSIYAANGYCFQTAKAQAVFGRHCYPPYGKLSPGEQNQVDELQVLGKPQGLLKRGNCGARLKAQRSTPLRFA